MATHPVLRGPKHVEENTGPLSNDEKKRARAMFDKYDRDCSGEMDFKELSKLLKDMHITLSNKQLDEYCGMSMIDLKEYQKVDMGLAFSDFLHLYEGILRSQTKPVQKNLSNPSNSLRAKLSDMKQTDMSMRTEFDRFDSDHNGCIDKEEMQGLIVALGFAIPRGDTLESFTERQFRRADKDSNGEVSYQEFVDYTNALQDDIMVARQLGEALRQSVYGG